MSKNLSRREMLSIGSVVGLSILGAGISGYAVGSTPDPSKISFPYPYKKLKLKKTALRAYQNLFVAGCCYGVFEAIVGQLADKYGKPYNTFPMGMVSFGSGGIGGWGSVCGCVNGAAMAIAMFYTGADRSALTSEVLAWYERTKLPIYKPKHPIVSDQKIATSVADSILCHASLANWLKRGGTNAVRGERCGRLTADVAAKTAELLNAQLKGKFVPVMPINKTAADCLTCHGSGGDPGNVLGKMTCTSCHEVHG